MIEPSRQAQLNGVAEVCEFIQAWFGWQPDTSSELDAAVPVPSAVRQLHHHLGHLWTSDSHSAFFDIQDSLIPPRDYEPMDNGIVPAIWENQGVWGCGFDPTDPEVLWVNDSADSKVLWGKADLPDEHAHAYEWRPVPGADLSLPMIYVLLGNTVWSSSDVEMDEKPLPDWATVQLWNHGPWQGFQGFWIDANRTKLRMQGDNWGVTAHPPAITGASDTE